MKENYSISEVSEMIGMHPNTIRLYETYEYISSVARKKNKYRIYEVKHIEQLKLVQIAFSNRIINKRIIDKIKDILLESGKEEYDFAIEECMVCKKYIEEEQQRISYAVKESHRLLSEACKREKGAIVVKRKEAAKEIGVSADVLRNWERNGLVQIEKDGYGCNIYTENSLILLRAVKLLRSVDFSIMSIINMREHYQGGDEKKLGDVLDSTVTEEGVYYTDHLISLLESVKQIIPDMIRQFQEIKKVSNSAPPRKSMVE